MSTDEDLRPPQTATDAGLNLGVGQPPADAMSVQQLMVYLTHQNQIMQNMMAMFQHDRPEIKAERLANVRLGERNFRTVPESNYLRSGWREWTRQFMAAVRECDVDFVDFAWAFEGREELVDHISELNPPTVSLQRTCITASSRRRPAQRSRLSRVCPTTTASKLGVY